MEKSKISFGFNKISKKSTLLPNKQAAKEGSKVELIKCLEGQEIKLVEEKKNEAALVIPMISNQRTTTALASLMKRRAVLLGEDENAATNEKTAPNKSDSTSLAVNGDSLENRAARELIAELQANVEDTDKSDLVVPVVKPDELPLDGAKESTLNDYDSIPIEQFGVAMLRGMGWVEPPKKPTGGIPDEGPVVRPKGMGLGADKALKAKPLLIPPEKNEVLEIKKQACVRILGGKFKDLYGQIEGFDDHAGRVIVKMAVGATKEAFNEFLCQPVSKKEYVEYGKCINTQEYKRLKEMESFNGQIQMKADVKEEPRIKTEKSDAKRDQGDHEDEKKLVWNYYRSHEKDIKSSSGTSKNHSSRNDDIKRNQKIKTEKYENEQKEKSPCDYDDNDSNYNKSSSSSRRSRQREDERNHSRKSRSPEHRSRVKHPSSSCSELRQNIRRKFELTDDSSGSESDSAAVVKYIKKPSKKSKHKSKKSKSKRDHRRYENSTLEDQTSVTSVSKDDEHVRSHRSRNHKKKTKKSKNERSRSRSRDRR